MHYAAFKGQFTLSVVWMRSNTREYERTCVIVDMQWIRACPHRYATLRNSSTQDSAAECCVKNFAQIKTWSFVNR